MLSAQELASMTTTVAAALDKSVPLYHKTTAPDGSGHTTESYAATPDLLLACTVSKPDAPTLALFADVISGKRAAMVRYMPTSDVREGDRIVYQGVPWRVQPIEADDSYTVTRNALIVTVT